MKMTFIIRDFGEDNEYTHTAYDDSPTLAVEHFYKDDCFKKCVLIAAYEGELTDWVEHTLEVNPELRKEHDLRYEMSTPKGYMR